MTSVGILQAAVAGVAILASAGIAGWVPSRERKIAGRHQDRARLDITTTRWPPVGLQLDISYRLEFTHVGLRANLTLLTEGSIKALRLVPNSAPPALRHAGLEQGSPFIGDKAEVPLVMTQTNGPSIGGLILLPSGEVSRPEDGMNRARIRVEVLKDGGEALTMATLVATPIDEARSF